MFHKTKSFQQIRDRITAFKSKEDGAIAVEGALILSVLAIGFVGLADFGWRSSAKTEMDHAIRASAQYYVNGGSSLPAGEEIFHTTFTHTDNVSFASSVRCSCARDRSTFDTSDADFDQDKAPADHVFQEYDTPQTDGKWQLCTIDCGGDPVVRYVRLSSSAAVSGLLKGDPQTISSEAFVRID